MFIQVYLEFRPSPSIVLIEERISYRYDPLFQSVMLYQYKIDNRYKWYKAKQWILTDQTRTVQRGL